MTPNACNPKSLTKLSSGALTARLAELLSKERRCIVDFLWHLAELDRRHTVLELGYASLFAYCTEALRLPNASAWRRTTAARLLVRFPLAAEYLADGRLCLSTFVLLRDVLKPENHRDLLERASLLSEDAVKMLLVTLQPRPEVKASIRRLPNPNRATAESAVSRLGTDVRASTAGSGPEATSPTAAFAPQVKSSAAASRPEVSSPTAASGPEVKSSTAASGAEKVQEDPLVITRGIALRRPVRIDPIDSQRYSLRMTVGAEFIAELAHVKSALSHVVPDGNLEAVLRVCFQKTLEVCGRRKLGRRSASRGVTARESMRQKMAPPVSTSMSDLDSEAEASIALTGDSTSTTPAGSGPEPEFARCAGGAAKNRYIAVEVRRAVWARDQGSCSFRGKDGKRCGSRHQLEFDHKIPFAWGGPPTVENLFLRCRNHNQHRARKLFGVTQMERIAQARASAAQKRQRALIAPKKGGEREPTAAGCAGLREERGPGPPTDRRFVR
jgi:hypothetical protein